MSSREIFVDELERWVLFGATWRPVEISADHAVIDLRECTGQFVERRHCHDPATVEYVKTHVPSRDP